MLIDRLRKQYIYINKRSRAIKKYKEDKSQYCMLLNSEGGIPITKENPQLYDYLENAAKVDSHYFLQDIFAAEMILESGVKKHFDIGSRVDGFIAHLLSNPAIEEIVMIDIRPFPIDISKLSFIQADATSLENIEDSSIKSISALHSIEHFGLGRYGDRIEPMACFMAMKAIQRVTMTRGFIYISVPVTMKDECCFNAHRIFSPKTIMSQFDQCSIDKMILIHSGFRSEEISGCDAEEMLRKEKYDLGPYDCGLFKLVKN